MDYDYVRVYHCVNHLLTITRYSLVWYTTLQRHFPSKQMLPFGFAEQYTIDLVIFACLDFREFMIFGLFTKSKIRELSILMIGNAHNNNFREISKFANLFSSRILPDLQYIQVQLDKTYTVLNTVKYTHFLQMAVFWKDGFWRPDGIHGEYMMCSTEACLVLITQQQTKNICITFIQRWINVEAVGPSLYKCHTNGLCLLGITNHCHTCVQSCKMSQVLF